MYHALGHKLLMIMCDDDDTNDDDDEQRYIYNTKRISARARTRIKNLLVRNIVWCFSYRMLCGAFRGTFLCWRFIH